MTVVAFKTKAQFDLECSQCGASTEAPCNCGARYNPIARANQALQTNPNRTDRAIAREIGVDHKTVGKAREARGDDSPPGVRRGNDGKNYPVIPKPAPAKRKPIPADPIQETCDDCDTPQQFWERSFDSFAGDAIAMEAFWIRQFGDWEKFDVSSARVTLALQAAEAWTKVARKLKVKHGKKRKTKNSH